MMIRAHFKAVLLLATIFAICYLLFFRFAIFETSDLSARNGTQLRLPKKSFFLDEFSGICRYVIQ